MREVKYQAYLTDENRMVQVEVLNLIKNTKGEHEYLSIGFYLDEEDKIEGTGFVLSEAKLRQYTGLKDSNTTLVYPDGIEIYEHDILYDPITNDYFIVTYDENYANFFLKNVDDSPDKPDYDFAEYDTDVCNSLYVVGNIYENPELLGGAK